MPRIACLTLADPRDFVIDDALLHTELRQRGWTVDVVPWTAASNWAAYDRVLIRTPWDYQQAPDRFLGVLEGIDASGTRLDNPLDVVRWNLDKRYLRDVQRAGVPVVPSVWMDAWDEGLVRESFDALGCARVVLKPTVSANADHTYPLTRAELDAKRGRLARVFARRPALIQPFLDEILTLGEVSLFYFGGHFSHAIRKQPAAGDFRVQEEHGGTITTLDPDPALRRAGQAALAAVARPVLYARVDLVRTRDGVDRVMELELIEPSLYFRMHPRAAANLADALEDD